MHVGPLWNVLPLCTGALMIHRITAKFPQQINTVWEAYTMNVKFSGVYCIVSSKHLYLSRCIDTLYN